jgi:hypothetical protein
MLHRPIRQIAYYVADAAEAAARHSHTFGSGPFFVVEHVPYVRCIHRGVERAFDHTTALGQWGELMIEFVQLHSTGPSVCHDMYPEGSDRWGIHHVALIVDDLEVTRRELEDGGFPTVCELTTEHICAYYADAVRTHGHFIEYYRRGPFILNFYGMVADAAKDFDGTSPVRSWKPAPQ